MGAPINVFIAGIIQGSLPDTIHDQDYRSQIAELIRDHVPGAEVFDPIIEYPGSLEYTEEQGRDAFFDLMDRAGQVDVLVSFVPEASMGTAIEMWNAYHAGAVILCVSGLTENWVIRFLSDKIVPDVVSLEQFLRDGGLEKLLSDKIGFEE